MIPPNMKSGPGHPSYEEPIDVKSLVDLDPTIQRLIATVAVMTENASISAAVLASHRHDIDREVTTIDVHHALKATAMHFLDEIDDPMTQHIIDMENYMFNGGPEPGRDVFKPMMETLPDVNGTGSTCRCTVCSRIQTAEREWTDWNPDDDAKQFLKHSVEKSIQQIADMS